jgi:hypothetical protein
MAEFASKGVAGSGLGLGIAGTALGVLNGGLGNVLGGIVPGMARAGCCSEDHMVNRYEAAQSARIAELETEVKLRDANTYTDSKILELYRYVDGRFGGVEAQICQQAVVNAQVTANLSCLQNTVNVLSGLTKTIIPIDNICPPPMERFNSWTAPTAPTT